MLLESEQNLKERLKIKKSKNKLSAGAEIGRQAGLRGQCSQERGGSNPLPRTEHFQWAGSSTAEHRVYIARVIGSNPFPPTNSGRGSSVVERFSEKEEVASSILARGTNMRVSYNGYYISLPRIRWQFNSAHPLPKSLTFSKIQVKM